MKRSSCEGRNSGGFTLAELLVATAVTSLVLTSICGIYFTVSKEWEREQGEAEALAATSLACSRLADYLARSTGATVLTRITSNDALAINVPSDTAYGGTQIPVWSGGKLVYRGGTWVVFYLSDTTGSYLTPGRILWAGNMSWSGFPGSVSPDAAWSLYYGSSKGRIAPLTSLSFSMDSTGERPSVTVTAVARYKTGTGSAQVSQSRTVCLRNAN